MTATVYLYRGKPDNERDLCQAIAGDDGRVLFHWYSSSARFARRDMEKPRALAAYDRNFPGGYEIKELFGTPWTKIPMLVEFEEQGIEYDHTR